METTTGFSFATRDSSRWMASEARAPPPGLSIRRTTARGAHPRPLAKARQQLRERACADCRCYPTASSESHQKSERRTHERWRPGGVASEERAGRDPGVLCISRGARSVGHDPHGPTSLRDTICRNPRVRCDPPGRAFFASSGRNGPRCDRGGDSGGRHRATSGNERHELSCSNPRESTSISRRSASDDSRRSSVSPADLNSPTASSSGLTPISPRRSLKNKLSLERD